jgi:hypothetical protein
VQDAAFFQLALILVVRPNACKAIRLQLDLDLQMVGGSVFHAPLLLFDDRPFRPAAITFDRLLSPSTGPL